MTPTNQDFIDASVEDGKARYSTDTHGTSVVVRADHGDSTIRLEVEGWLTLKDSKALRRLLKAFEQSLK